jgi:hypothetical protein
MERIHERTAVHSSLMMDVSGYVFFHHGPFPFLPPQEFGVIVSASYMALKSLSSMTAAKDLTVKFHDSPIGAVMISQITNRIILAFVFDEMAADESQIRDQMGSVTKEMKEHFAEQLDTSENSSKRRPPVSSVRFIEEKLDEIFNEL